MYVFVIVASYTNVSLDLHRKCLTLVYYLAHRKTVIDSDWLT